jgi:hypothetical protein
MDFENNLRLIKASIQQAKSKGASYRVSQSQGEAKLKLDTNSSGISRGCTLPKMDVILHLNACLWTRLWG